MSKTRSLERRKHRPPPFLESSAPATMERKNGFVVTMSIQDPVDLLNPAPDSVHRHRRRLMGESGGTGEEELRECDFLFISNIAAGNSSSVSKVVHTPTGLLMGRKSIPVQGAESRGKQVQIMKELRALDLCNSPFIVGFYGAYFCGYDLHICLEYMDGHSLDLALRKCGRVTEPIIAKIAFAIVSALDYLLTEHDMIHRDVTPSNILVNSKGQIKICDLGVSTILQDSVARSFRGTQLYMAPERLEGKEHGASGDIWSLGITLVELALGRYPIPTPTRTELADRFDLTPQSIQMMDKQDLVPRKLSPPRGRNLFSQLEYIVKHPPPLLPTGILSRAFDRFTAICLSKSVNGRGQPGWLQATGFLLGAKVDVVDVAGWVCTLINTDLPTPNRP